jgi:glycosyltransferase involved in cell wall biosynthesis
MEPLISVVTPVYNGEKHFAECIESVLAQTYQNWEFVIVNNCSNDKTVQIAKNYAKSDCRIRIENNDRFVSINDNWNNAFKLAKGRYVYGLSSDDFAPPVYLEILVQALEAHPECDIAHTKLRLVDEEGRDVLPDWWSKHSLFARSSEGLLDRKHIRLAPFDGLLHLEGATVYHSFTQLLIRRTLFDRIGLLETRWGSMGDFNWDMRATLVADTIHVPDTWGGWRVHSGQATAELKLHSEEEYRSKHYEMIDHALRSYGEYLAQQARRPLQFELTACARQILGFLQDIRTCKTSLRRKAFLAGRLLTGSWLARLYVNARLSGSDPVPKLIRDWLESAGTGPVLLSL